MTIECRKCRELKPAEEFAWRSRAAGTRQSWCRDCVGKRDREEAPNRRAKKLQTNKIGMRRRKLTGMQQVISYLKEHPCVDCGETDVVVLDFDHKDPTTKRDDLGRLIAVGYSWEYLQTEMNKCDVRCSNCHRRKTARERNTLRWQYAHPNPSGEGLA